MASEPPPLSGRRVERDLLEGLLRSERSEFLAVYGRRRVGKTFLVRSFFAGRPVTFFEMMGRYGGTGEEHRRIFAESLGEAYYGGADLEVPTDWHAAFRRLREAIESDRRRGRRQVLFFDELPWIATPRSGFLAELEHFWNAWCSRRNDILLIVCGSAASWMLRKIVHARGGLHDRLTETMRLLPFRLSETRAFFRDRRAKFSEREIVELSMVFGGVPHYLDRIDRSSSVPRQVDRVCLAKDGALHREFDRLFASLFEDDESYVAVVRALAAERRGLTRNELLAATGLASGGGTTRILENLEEGGFVTSSVPFGRASRDRFFRLTDEFSLFHLKWMGRRRPKSWQLVRGTPAWRAWAGLAYESLCIKHSDAIERALGIAGVDTQVSAWLHRDAQVDLVIDRADGVVSVCEVEFTDEPFRVTKKVADEVRAKLEALRTQTRTRKRFQVVFVTSCGVAPGAHARELVDRVVTMEELFDDGR